MKTSGDTKQTFDFEREDWLSPLLSFLENNDPKEISQFIAAVFYIVTNPQQIDHDKKLGGDDIAPLFELSINSQLYQYQKKHKLKVKEIIFLSEKLETILSKEIQEEGSIVSDTIKRLKRESRESFLSNNIPIDKNIEVDLGDMLTSMTNAHVAKVLLFVRLLRNSIVEACLEKETLLHEGIQSGIADSAALQRDANHTVASMQGSITSSAHRNGEWKNRQLPVSGRPEKKHTKATLAPAKKTSLSFKEKWKALPLKWKILLGMVIALTAGGIAVATILFPPVVIVELLGLAVTSTHVSVAVGSAVVVTAGAAHMIHIAKTNIKKGVELPKTEQDLEVQKDPQWSSKAVPVSPEIKKGKASVPVKSEKKASRNCSALFHHFQGKKSKRRLMSYSKWRRFTRREPRDKPQEKLPDLKF